MKIMKSIILNANLTLTSTTVIHSNLILILILPPKGSPCMSAKTVEESKDNDSFGSRGLESLLVLKSSIRVCTQIKM